MKTKCAYCPLEHEYNDDNDNYPELVEETLLPLVPNLDQDISITRCTCGAVLAMFVSDKFGGNLYVSCTEEL